jgi:hypothetical protein
MVCLVACQSVLVLGGVGCVCERKGKERKGKERKRVLQAREESRKLEKVESGMEGSTMIGKQ